jgi:dTDP-4-dehydrorhamnose 3,5-epimerase
MWSSTSGSGHPATGAGQLSRSNDETRCAVFVAEGLGHAFLTLSDEATVLYLCTTPYAPAVERGVHPLDPDIGIAWPEGVEIILSDKDAAAPSLLSARAAGQLPDYGNCLAYATERLTHSERLSRTSRLPLP